MSSAYSFDHILRLTDNHGLFEHAEFDLPRLSHGYCVDDVARGLVAVSRESEPTLQVTNLAPLYLEFIISAQSSDGRSHNRKNTFGKWTDLPSVEDCWGRSLWALGSTVRYLPNLRGEALIAFERGMVRRSPHLHAMSFAALGAAEILKFDSSHLGAQNLLREAAQKIDSSHDQPWPWPESRLRYANGVIPQVLMLAGHLLNNQAWLDSGLKLLEWLLQIETNNGHISVTPVDGWGLDELRPGYDQQPIEVASLADACRTAYDITQMNTWLNVIRLCAAWFDGDNDSKIVMTNPEHSIGFDGLQKYGHNQNCGAESTLAMLTTFQQLQSVLVHA